MNNSPAFPVLIVDRPKELIQYNGMTLRDYFAAKAMPAVPDQTAYNMKPKESHEAYVSRRSYEMADAMLKAREQ
jgi:hypothetical protein